MSKRAYSGINQMSTERSNGEVTRVYLHSLFDHPHTSCGCFEAIGFYIPEVDGIGIVHRDFRGVTPFGIPFSTMAGQIGGGVQSEGFMGMAIEYLRSSKYLLADGGWERTVWLPKALKERIGEDIPKELVDKIATEEDAAELDPLKAFLKEKGHPVVKRWKEEKAEEEVTVRAGEPVSVPQFEMPAAGGGVTIIFKNAKIYAEKVIIKRKEK